MKNLLIIGAGGFGREVLSWAHDNPCYGVEWTFGGFLDGRPGVLDGYVQDPWDLTRSVPHDPKLKARYRRDLRIAGDPLTYAPQPEDVFLCALGDPADRRKYTAPLLERGGQFLRLMHPQAQVSVYVNMGAGTIIGPYAGISPDVSLGAFVTVNSYSAVAHDAVVGDWCEIGGHCLIAGRARIGDGVRIHGGSVVTPDTHIGDGAVVGAGSVVFGRIPAGATVLGNPARKFTWT